MSRKICPTLDAARIECYLTHLREQERSAHTISKYALDHDLSQLADLLGHSSIMTTRIYTVECGAVHARQVERLRLVVT